MPWHMALRMGGHIAGWWVREVYADIHSCTLRCEGTGGNT